MHVFLVLSIIVTAMFHQCGTFPRTTLTSQKLSNLIALVSWQPRSALRC